MDKETETTGRDGLFTEEFGYATKNKELRAFAILFEDASIPPEIIVGETLAREVFRHRKISWNCYLFECVEDATTPLFLQKRKDNNKQNNPH